MASNDDAHQTYLRHRVQTEKARITRWLNLEKRKHKVVSDDQKVKDKEAAFCERWYAGDFEANRYSTNYYKEMAVAVFAHLKAFTKKLGDVLSISSAKQSLINISIVDDSDISLHQNQHQRRSKISTMNNQQRLLVRASSVWNIPIVQPFMLLHGTTTSSLFDRWVSWSPFTVAGGVGWIFQKFGLCAGMLKGFFHFCQAQCLDGLPTNTAVTKGLRCALVQYNKNRQENDPVASMFEIKCLLHGGALTRKHICLGFGPYWSHLVRLAHLLESHAFRQKLVKAMKAVIASDFEYIKVSELPEDIVLEMSKQHTVLKTSTRRFKYVADTLDEIINHDNGDPSSSTFVHWCVGCCANDKAALRKTCDLYQARFERGYSKPLLYRWKGAPDAQAYTNEACICSDWFMILLENSQQVIKATYQSYQQSTETCDIAH